MVTKEEAMMMWKMEMDDKEYAYDFSGKKIKKDEYLQNNRVGWVVAYMKPLELGGPDNSNNTIIMHHETYEERANNYPNFKIVGKEYTVKYDEKEDFYYIEKVEIDDGFFI